MTGLLIYICYKKKRTPPQWHGAKKTKRINNMKNDDLNYVNLIISPHLDDAVFSLGGLIAKEPQITKVVTIFSGAPSKPLIRIWDICCGFKNSKEALIKRIDENILALCSLGINKQQIINLQYVDNQYRSSFLGLIKDSTLEEIEKSILVEIELLIKNEGTRNLKIFAPMSFTHKDHKMVHDILIKFYKNNTESNKKICLYLYQDIPYFYSNYSKKIKRAVKSEEQILNEMGPKISGYEREVIELTEEEFSKKREASKLYGSQFVPIFSKLSSLIKIQYILSKKQTNILHIKSPHCEIVYKLK